MRVLLTGASGFIGQNLVPLLQAEHEVISLRCDLLDFTEVQAEVMSVQPQLIVHLAARTEVEKSFQEPIVFSSVNYVGTVNLIEAARRARGLRLFLFASTMETYGWQPESDEVVRTGRVEVARAFDENTPQHPNAPYAVAKVACERYLEYAGRSLGVPWCALRQTNTYGRADNDFFVVEQFITQMLANRERVTFGNPDPYRNFLYIDDLMDLYLRVLANPDRARGQAFCTGPDNAIQIRELATRLAKKTGFDGEVVWGQKPAREGEIFYLNSTAAKAKNLLEWEPTRDLDTGLDRTIEVWRGR